MASICACSVIGGVLVAGAGWGAGLVAPGGAAAVADVPGDGWVGLGWTGASAA